MDLSTLRNPARAISLFKTLLTDGKPFTFARFSDGEVVILGNEKLQISPEGMQVGNQRYRATLPAHDFKDFDPSRDGAFRNDLLAALDHRAPLYFKGVPTRHNDGGRSRELLMALSGSDGLDYTFADLLVNGNYRFFRESIVPEFDAFPLVVMVANFRAAPAVERNGWKFCSVPDNFIESYPQVLEHLEKQLLQTTTGGLVLASASSLSNVLAYKLNLARPDLTFLDIGTAMHNFLGLGWDSRTFMAQTMDWTVESIQKKARYLLSRKYKMRW